VLHVAIFARILFREILWWINSAGVYDERYMCSASFGRGHPSTVHG